MIDDQTAPGDEIEPRPGIAPTPLFDRTSFTRPTAIGLGWYRREDWNLLLQIFPDRDTLQDTFDSWEADARKLERQLKRRRLLVKRVIVDPGELLVWCALHGLEPVATARSQYVSERLRRGLA